MSGRRKRIFIIAALLCAVTALLVKNYFDLNDVRVVRREAPPAIARAMRGMKILYMSDMHFAGKLGRRAQLVLDLVEKENPDYVLIGGDTMEHFGRTDAVIEFYRKLKFKRGAYAVLGDAEYDQGVRNCAFCHKDGSWAVRGDLPVRTLRDQAVVLNGAEGPAAWLWGKDGARVGGDMRWTAKDKSGLPVIGMSHYPGDFNRLADGGADMVLAGDTHGGQTWAPRFFLKYIFSPDRFKYLYGRFTRGQSTMFVTSGVGWSSLPIRLGVKPEVVVFDFTKPDN